MLKKSLCILLAVALLALTAACNSAAPAPDPATPPPATEAPAATEEPAPSESEGDSENLQFADPYTLVYYMYAIKASDQDVVVEEAMNKILQPKFNATLDLVMITSADWDSKALVPLRAGEKIDILYTPEWLYFMTNIANGSLIKLNDPEGPNGDLLAQYAPKTVEDLGPFIPGNQVDGYNYSVPIKKELCVPGGLIWNVDYVEKYGIDVASVRTYEQIDPYLALFKADNPAQYPILGTTSWSFISPFVRGFLNSMDPISIRIGEPGGTDGAPEIIWESQEARAHVEQMGEWAKKGYVNPDAQLKTFSSSDSLNAGQFLVLFEQQKGGQVKAKELMSSSGNPDLRLIEQQTAPSAIFTTDLGGSMVGIPITCKDPVRTMCFINEMYQNTELLNTMAWGVEGVHYTLDDQGRAIQTPMNGWSDSHGGKWTILGNQFKQLVSNQEDIDKYAQMQALTDEAWNHESLGFRFKQDDYSTEYAATYNVTDALQRGVLSGVNAAALDEMIAGYKAAGVYDVILPAVQEAYAAWKAEKMAQNPNFPAN
jgi:putative aldouronate transport system substrate-binding protein